MHCWGWGRGEPLAADEPIGETLVALAAARAGARPPKVLAIDLPTGLDADGGGVDPLTVAADLTVTFGLPKVGMYQAMGSGVVGTRAGSRHRHPGGGDGGGFAGADHLALGARGASPPTRRMRTRGHSARCWWWEAARAIAGRPALAATAAYRAGAGLVTIACPEPVIASIAPAVAEATWLPQEAAEDGGLTGEAALALRAGVGRLRRGCGRSRAGTYGRDAVRWSGPCFPTWRGGSWRDASSSTQTR